MTNACKQLAAAGVALAVIAELALSVCPALARGGGGHGGHGGGGHAASSGSSGGGNSGGGSGFHPNPNGPYSGINQGSTSYASPQQNTTFVPRQNVSRVRYGGGGGGRRRYYNNNYPNNTNQQMAPPPSQYQSQVFSGPAYISPSGYHHFVKSYSWPSAAETLPASAPALPIGQAATAQLLPPR